MFMGLQRFRRALGRVLALAVVVPIAIVVTSPPAHADPPPYETALKQVVADTATWAEGGLSRVGRLAQPLPLLGVSPGSLVDADKLVRKVSDALVANGLSNSNRDLGGGAFLTSTLSDVDGGKQLDLTLTAKRQVLNQDFTAGGITAAAAVNVTGWATLRLKARYANGEAFLVSDADAPRLDVDAIATLRADLQNVSASVGILEVSLLSGETQLRATAHFLATLNDPNHDGKLAFGSGGEMSAPGSVAGLVQVGLDTTGGGKTSDTETEGGPGSIAATLKLGAAATGAPAGLPTLNASVTVTWPDINTGSPQVVTTGLDDTIAKFKNMTPQDLASGLAQLAMLLAGVQQSGGAGNLDLPFLKGSFADAVKINEKIVGFLKKYVYPKPEDPEFVPGVDDPARAGQPKFTSIQQLIKLLSDEGLLSNAPLTFAGDRLSFTISLGRTSTVEEALDPGAAGVSGRGATFLPDGFTLPTNRFQPGALKGQRVVAGTSAGTVKDNTANSVTLETEWIGGRPADDSPWVISSSDAHVGAVQFGSTITAVNDDNKQVGLRTANAQQSLAKVRPSYTAALTLVLDLHNDLGSPEANADRVFLHTDPSVPLFTANFPISSAIDFFAKVGFLKVRINGSLAVGPAFGVPNMLQVKFKQAQDISLGHLFQQLQANPGNLFAVTSSVRTTGQAKISVPGDTGALGQGATVSFSWEAGGEPVINATNLDGLFSLDFNADDPNALFATVVEALKLVNQALASANGGSGILDQQIPLVGKSARQLLGTDESGVGGKVSYTADGQNFLLKDDAREGDAAFGAKLAGRTIVIGSKAYRILDFVDGKTLRIAAAGTPVPELGAAYAVRPELTEAVDKLLANPPETLQDALDIVNKAIGEGSGITFTFDQREGGPFLRVGLDWKRHFHVAQPMKFSWSGVGDLVSLDSSGALSLDISGRAQLGLLLPLALDSAPLLDHTSSASVTVAAGANEVALAARVGPLAIDIGKGPSDFASVQGNLKFQLANPATEDQPVIDGLLGLSPSLTTDGTDCGGGVGGATVPLCARAPIFINDCTTPPGSNVLSFQLDTDLHATSTLPDLTACLNSLALKFTDFNVGIDGYLAKVEEALRLASFDGKLPLVGDDLQEGQQFIHQLREDIKSKIGDALANAPANSDGLKTVLETELHKLDPSLSVGVDCVSGVAAPCALTDIQRVRLSGTISKGAPSIADGCGGNDCLAIDVPLDLGIPGISLKAKQGATDGVHVKLGWKLHLDLVLDRTEGFYVATHSGSDLSPELQIGASFDAGDLDAQLAFIQVSAHKKTTTPLVTAYFGIDLRSSADEQSCFTSTPCAADPDAKLTLGEMGDLGTWLKTNLNATVNIQWELTARIDPSSDIGSAMPGVSVDFTLTWSLSNATGSLQAGDLHIEFSNLALDMGSFFSKVLKPILEKLKAVTGPLQPVIDTLYAPIPVLSDLSHAVGGPDITLIWLAQTFSTLEGGPDLTFVHTIKAVIDFVRKVPTCSSSCKIPLGSFLVDPAKALTTLASPASAQSLITDPQPVSSQDVKNAVDSKATGEKIFSSGNDTKLGFKFPIFDNPASLFGLIMGQDVELISFDSGPLSLGFSWRQSFGPVYAPPPVFVTLSGSASISARFIAGLDTKGIRNAIEAATNGTPLKPIDILDGLYFKTTDDKGNAVPVVTLKGEIAAGAEVSVLIIKVGVEGGVQLTVGFMWNDPNNDGKFRTSEFLQRLLVNPICLFTTSGKLSVFLRVYFEIDLFLFKKKWSFTLVNATLLDFRAQPDCDPPPPQLGGTVGDTLVVFAGRFGQTAQRGHSVWSNTNDTYSGDVFKVYALHFADPDTDPTPSDDFDGFAVEGLGRRMEFMDPHLTRVVVDGRGYSVGDASKTAMSIVLLGDGNPKSSSQETSSFDKTAVIMGSEGIDSIRTGTGPAFVDGRGGDDVIVTGEKAGVTSWVTGGGGDDTISTGDGDDIVAGDGTLGDAQRNLTVVGEKGNVSLTNAIDWDHLVPPASDVDGGSGKDTISVGHGSNTAYGNGGDDTIAAMVDTTHPNGPNVLVGGAGADTINGGNGNDKIYTYSQAVSSDVDDAGLGDTTLINSVDTGGGTDEVYGAAGTDLVVSHSANGQTGKIYGYGGADVLLGGFGTDQIFGGPGDDYVIAEPSDVSETDGNDAYGPFRHVTHQPLPAGVQSQAKLLVGGLDHDHIIGGDGGATIFGDKYLVAEACADNANYFQVNPADQGASDLILGGAGVDVVSAGSGDDRAELGEGNDRACGQLGDDTLSLGGGGDKGWGGFGTDTLYGDAGADFLYGNEDNDGLYGGSEVDTMEGNNGTDNLFGGDGDDFLFGGTRAAGAADQGDFLYGEKGSDHLVGDNGAAEGYPLDLSGAFPIAGGADVIFGGANDDFAYGGLANDTINGDEDNDYLEGNNATDTIHGNTGTDVIIGGSSEESAPGAGRPDAGDFLYGDADADLIAGDNARITTGASTRLTLGRGTLERQVILLDLGMTPAAGTSGPDLVEGDAGNDVLLGQGDTDRVLGGSESDYAEGGPGSDWVEGDGGDDDLVGGSFVNAPSTQPDTADNLFGGPGSDVILGDNGIVLRPIGPELPSPVTARIGADGHPIVPRIVTLYDTAAANPTRFGGDRISGGDGVDLAWGQDGDDAITGDGDADYAEGNGGQDTLRGDLPLAVAGHTTVTPLPAQPWPGTAGGAADLIGVSTPDGQDDLIGGSSAQAFRDTTDTIEGNGGDDVILGDNGSLLRTIVNGKEKVYSERYPTGADLTNATVVRSHNPALPGPSTRFCTTAQTTCEPVGAYGADVLYGDNGNDGIWAQDGDDTVYGGSGDDDLFGELGADTIYGEAGQDAILGDRGGVMNQFLNADDVAALGFSVTLSSTPQESFTGFRPGYYDRRVDLLHDTDGDVWVGGSTSTPMVYDGINFGGNDRIRGGAGNDNLHGAFGDDLINGDSGGDMVFGSYGSDILWGGKGCDPVLDANEPECKTNGVFDPTARGSRDQFVDHVFGGASISVDQGIGSDLLDFKPRGTYPDCVPGLWPQTTGNVTKDPCVWFEWTDMTNASDADNQHHQGTDWLYGGWDRDVLQGDVAQSGPNPGDRLFDWNGAYNLYTHCNAAYGGYNDIRQLSPALQTFLTKVAWSDGLGRSVTDVSTANTSAFLELAFTYMSDINGHGSGSAYPTTPGHFDDPTSCTD
jgi:Ca2+-binding RTX toxin-like protein